MSKINTVSWSGDDGSWRGSGFDLSRRATLRGLVGAGIIGLAGVSGVASAAPTPAPVSLVASGTDTSVTGVGSGPGTDPSSAAAYDYLVNTATFTSHTGTASLSPYHEGNNTFGSSFDQADWIWSAGAWDETADTTARFESTVTLTDASGPFTLTYAADNFAVALVNGTYIGGGVTWGGSPAVTSVDVTGYLGAGANTIEVRGLNSYNVNGTASPAGVAYELVGPAQPISVQLDVKPGNGDEVDPINPNAGGVIPVAVYSTADFDATTLDVSTLAFGPGGAGAVHGGHDEDVDGDGLVDLVVHFRTADAGFSAGDTTATLTGETAGGVPVVGTDEIRLVGGQGRGGGRGRGR